MQAELSARETVYAFRLRSETALCETHCLCRQRKKNVYCLIIEYGDLDIQAK